MDGFMTERASFVAMLLRIQLTLITCLLLWGSIVLLMHISHLQISWTYFD
jgi:hypothetical protein